MAEHPLVKLEDDLKAAVNNKLDIRGLQKQFEEHIDELIKHKDEVAPKIKEVWAKLLEALVELKTEQNPRRRTLIQRRIGSYKRAHLSYLKSIEQKALWETASSIWDTVQHVKNFVVSLINLVPV